MTFQEVEQSLQASGFIGGPDKITVGTIIDGKFVKEIKNTVDGKATYASTFVLGEIV